MVKVFVSGCYDILHAGHIKFFEDAKSLGDHLTVSFASDRVLFKHKKRKSSLPEDNKKTLLQSISVIDEVVVGKNSQTGLDFKDEFLRIRPDILAVTEDDEYKELKQQLCKEIGARYIVLAKTPSSVTQTSTSNIVKRIQAPLTLPLRVDFGGGWLDVPKFSKHDAFIVNCSVSPLVSLFEWKYKLKSGLGGSAAWAMLNGSDGVISELDLGVGWQDPAVIKETGLCVWRSGKVPILEFKRNGDFLKGLMALYFTGEEHNTPLNTNITRDFELIRQAGQTAANGVFNKDLKKIAEGINISYHVQQLEGMSNLPNESTALAKKYCGGGWGGYALYLFDSHQKREQFVIKHSNNSLGIEPFLKNV